MALTDAELEEVAAEIDLTAEAFAQHYEPLAKVHAPDEMHFKVMRALKSRGISPFAAALKVARDRGFLDHLVQELVEAGAFDEKEDRLEEMTVRLQAIVNPDAGIWDVGLLSSQGLNAIKLICRIGIALPGGGDASGTGFLVGPQAVMTSWHVVRGLLDANGRPLPNSSKLIEVEFGRIRNASEITRCQVLDGDWLIAGSPPHANEDPGHLPATPVEDASSTGYDEALDYAVIWLAEPVGNRLGYYRLEPDRMPTLGELSRIFVLQHPDGGTMRWTTGNGVKLWPPNTQTRLSHTANTLAGSSGGAVFDHSFRPVAIHQSAVQTPEGLVNGAIPTAPIVKHGGDFCAIRGFVPLATLSDGTPIIGRNLFQRYVYDASGGGVRIIAVSGGRRTGRTFSDRILTDLLPPQHNIMVRIKAAEIPTAADALAQTMVQRLGINSDDVPSPEMSDTGKDGWIRDRLFPVLSEKLRQAAGERTLWLVLDELDLNPLANSTSRHLLELLYSNAATMPFLRVVLLGLDGPVPATQGQPVAYEALSSFTEEELKECLQRCSVSGGVALPLEEIGRHAKFIREMAVLSGEFPVPAAAKQVDVLVRSILL